MNQLTSPRLVPASAVLMSPAFSLAATGSWRATIGVRMLFHSSSNPSNFDLRTFHSFEAQSSPTRYGVTAVRLVAARAMTVDGVDYYELEYDSESTRGYNHVLSRLTIQQVKSGHVVQQTLR